MRCYYCGGHASETMEVVAGSTRTLCRLCIRFVYGNLPLERGFDGVLRLRRPSIVQVLGANRKEKADGKVAR